MDDLDFARMNVDVQEALESRPIYNPQVADYAPHPLAGLPSLDDGALQPVDEAYEVSAVGGRCWPRAPFEPIP